MRSAIALFAAVIAIATGLGCAPPPLPPGFVSTAPGFPRQFDLAAAGGVGAQEADPDSLAGGGGLQVEPYVTPRVSIPIELGGGASHVRILGSGNWMGYAAMRTGVRWRLRPHLALGAGVGGASIIDTEDHGGLMAGPLAGTFDAEVASSARWGSLALSGVFRPSIVVSGRSDWQLYGTFAVAPAWFLTPNLALTGHVVGGPITYGFAAASGFIGGGAGLFVHL